MNLLVMLKNQMMLLPWNVNAKPSAVNPNAASGDNAIEKLLNSIISYVPYIGAFFFLLGIIQIVLAIRSGEQNPDSISGAVKNLIVGIILFAFTAVWTIFWN